MKSFKILTGALFLLLTITAYAFASNRMPEKYNFDGKLVNMKQITNHSFIGWEKVDRQSFVLQTTPSRYYLIVLSYPADNLPYTEDIGITGQSLMIRPGYDNVLVQGFTGRMESYIINKIYKIENRKQVREVVAEITGPPKSSPPTKKSSSGKSVLASATPPGL